MASAGVFLAVLLLALAIGPDNAQAQGTFVQPSVYGMTISGDDLNTSISWTVTAAYPGPCRFSTQLDDEGSHTAEGNTYPASGLASSVGTQYTIPVIVNGMVTRSGGNVPFPAGQGIDVRPECQGTGKRYASHTIFLNFDPSPAPVVGIGSATASATGTTSGSVSVTLRGTTAQDTTTVYHRYRVGAGSWTNGSVSVTGSTGTFTLTGLTADTTYTVELSLAANFGNATTKTFTTHEIPTLTGLRQIGSVGHDRITIEATLTNPDSVSATVYWELRRDPNQASCSIATWAASTTSTHSTATTGTTARRTFTGLDAQTCYDLRASLSQSFDATSPREDFVTVAAPRATAVSLVSVTGTSATVRVTLTNAHSASATVYGQAYRVGGGSDGSLVSATTSGTSVNLTFTGLRVNTEYNFWVSTDSSLPGTNRVESAAYRTAPADIESVVVSNLGFRSATVTATLDRTSVTVYFRYRGRGVTQWTTGETTVGSSREGIFSFTTLTSGTTYDYQVSVFGDYRYPETGSWTTTTGPTLSFAGGITTTARTASLTLTVTNPSNLSLTVTANYYAQSDVTATTALPNRSISSSGTVSWTITGLTPNTPYGVTASIGSQYGGGHGASFTTQAAVPAVSSVSATSASLGRSVNLSFTITDPQTAADTIYISRRTPPSSGTWSTRRETLVTGGSGTYTVHGLTPGTQYEIRVSTSPTFADASTATTTITTQAGIGITVPSPGSRSAVVNITLGNSGGDSLLVELRWRTPADTGIWIEDRLTTTSTSATFTITQLTPSTTYQLQADQTVGFHTPVTITFTTSANSGPTFAAANYVRQVEENSLQGVNVGDPITATDPESDTITYTLTGTDASMFDVGSATGQITVGATATLDYETATSHSVTIVATDALGATGSASVTIEVTNVAEAGILGRVVIRVARDGAGTDYGYESGSFGTLVSGQWPGDLFDDGNARTVSQLWEDAGGDWHLYYSGGTADDWLSNEEAQSLIKVTVTYHDAAGDPTGVDTRSFVLGGFIAGTVGDYGLRLAPPIPAREWDGQVGRNVAIEFRQLSLFETPATSPAALVDPPAADDSFIQWIAETTPGGPVVFQLLTTIIVFLGFVFKAPPGVWGVIMSAIVLVMTPWFSVVLGFGSTLGASLNFINVAVGSFSYKVLTARAE